jgi:hypothetical protein
MVLMPTTLPKSGHRYSVRWRGARPVPEGMNAVQLEVYALSSHPADQPREVQEAVQRLGLGTGWALYVTVVAPPARRLTAEQKGARRTQALVRRVTEGKRAIGPLFAQEVLDHERTRRADYYAGAEVNRVAAEYVAQVDAEDAARWEAYLEWWLLTHLGRALRDVHARLPWLGRAGSGVAPGAA